ncbi:hypothetical protein D3C71_1573750 [compost metagenome]
MESAPVSYELICLSNPFDKDRIKAMPMIPILEAKAVRPVRHFLVAIFLPDNFKAVKKLMLVSFSL